MVRGRPATYVALIEKRWHEHPRICDYLFAGGEVQGHRNVEAVSYSPKPALLLPPRQKLCSCPPVNAKSPRRNVNRQHFPRCAKYSSKARSGGRQGIIFTFHSYILARAIRTYCELDGILYSQNSLSPLLGPPV